MAVEQTEYFSLNQGNGLSPVVRAPKAGTQKTAKKAKAGSGSRLVPFFQGITVGAVLLIPVGVWCWVRVDTVVENAPAIVEHAPPSKGKRGVGATAWKKKPVKTHIAGSQPPAEIRPVASQAQAAPPVDADPPPVVLSPAPAQSAPVANLTPHADDQDHGLESPEKSKKGVWKTITSPFRGKPKDHTITGMDPSPDQK